MEQDQKEKALELEEAWADVEAAAEQYHGERSRGLEKAWAEVGSGRGRRGGGNRAGTGTGGECICTHCGATVPHQAGITCFDCGTCVEECPAQAISLNS
jgi:ferredoxin